MSEKKTRSGRSSKSGGTTVPQRTTGRPVWWIIAAVRSHTALGPVFTADNAVGAVLAAAARLAVLGEWERVKICPAGDCLWAFYDQSRNRSRH
jgi:predicted RNA-binding Zn ribbon-like protein